MPEGYTEIDVKLTRGVTKAKAYVLVKKDSYDSEEEFKEALINFVTKKKRYRTRKIGLVQ